MPLPNIDETGDLPPGAHRATLDEVQQCFGAAGGQRGTCTRRLSHIYDLAQRTGHLQRFIIFGSYVTAKPDPNDVDVVLVQGHVIVSRNALKRPTILASHLIVGNVIPMKMGIQYFQWLWIPACAGMTGLAVTLTLPWVLVMDDAFRLEDCPIEARGLFDHALAQARYGASIFWVRPGMLIEASIEEFIAYWEVKRDGSRRGIVEVVS